MKCKNKEFYIDGLQNSPLGMTEVRLHLLVTNDERGKTLSVDNGTLQYIIPVDEIANYLK